MNLRGIFLVVTLAAMGASGLAGEEPQTLHEAARTGDLTALERLLSTGGDPNAREQSLDLTPWQVASIHGRAEAAALLEKHGARRDAAFPEPGEALHRTLAARVGGEGPGFAVLVAKEGKVLFERGYGLARLRPKTPVSPSTVFRIGSVTKQFTAAAALLLEQDGRLQLSDTVAKHLPGYPGGEGITLFHLLTHTSGIYNYTSLPSFMNRVTKAASPGEVVGRFRNLAPDFAPGKGFAYCNSGYFLMGEIVRSVSGEAYEDLLRSRVFQRERMLSTGAHRPELALFDEARGYVFQNHRWVPAVNWHMSQAGGAGEFYSTVGDLYRWNEALFHDRVLGPAALAKAHTAPEAGPAGGANGLEGKYACGWVVDQMRGLKMIWHSGGLHGFSSELRRFPDQELTVVVLGNTMEGVGGLTSRGIAEIASRQYLWREMSGQPCFREFPLSEGVALRDYAGTYDLGSLGVLRSRVHEGRLQLRLATQPWGGVRASGRDEFRNEAVEATFSFVRDEKGKVNSVRLQQHGAALPGPRFQEPAEGKATIEELAGLAGSYEMPFGEISFRVDGKRRVLRGRVGMQPEFSYHPVKDEPDAFFCKEVRVRILFVRAEGAEVTGLILQQGPAMLPARKAAPGK
jgi:CubicO group peptidase (beta-lactamase class C family)